MNLVWKKGSIFNVYPAKITCILLWNLLFCLGYSVYQSLYNLYLNEATGKTNIGTIVGLGFLAYAVFSVAAGIMADRIGPRNSLLFGLFLLTGGMVGGALVESMPALYTFAILTGIGQAFTVVLFVPLLTEHSRPEERMRLFSVAYGSGTFALFLGTLGGGMLTELVKGLLEGNTLEGIRWSLIAAAISLVLSMVPLLWVRDAKRSSQGEKQAASSQRSDKKLKHGQKGSNKIGHYGAVKLLEGIGVGLTLPFINLFLSSRYQLSISAITGVLAAATLGTVFMIFLNPLITKRLGEARAMVMYQALGLPCLLMVGLITNVWVSAICFFLFRPMFYAIMPIQSKLVMDTIPSTKKGLASSVGFMTTTIGTGVASPISIQAVSHMGEVTGYAVLFSASALFIGASIIWFYVVFRGKASEQEKRQQKMAHLSTP